MYDLPEDELVSVMARILVRNHRDGWQNTLAPISPIDMVWLNNAVSKRRKKGRGSSDEQGRLDAFLRSA